MATRPHDFVPCQDPLACVPSRLHLCHRALPLGQDCDLPHHHPRHTVPPANPLAPRSTKCDNSTSASGPLDGPP
jgi:hypothetical protein